MWGYMRTGAWKVVVQRMQALGLQKRPSVPAMERATDAMTAIEHSEASAERFYGIREMK